MDYLSGLSSYVCQKVNSSIQGLKELTFGGVIIDGCNILLPTIAILGLSRKIYNDTTIPLEEKTWSTFDLIQSVALISVSAITLLIAIKNKIAKQSREHNYFKNIEDGLTNKKEVALYVFGEDDFLGTFNNSFPRMPLEEIEKAYQVVCKKNVGSIEEIYSILENLTSKGKVVKLLIINGHGDETSLSLTDNCKIESPDLSIPRTIAFLDNLAGIILRNRDSNIESKKYLDKKIKNIEKQDPQLKKMFNLLDKKATIVLYSCSTGCPTGKENVPNLAQHIAKLASGREVIAASGYCKGIKIKSFESLNEQQLKIQLVGDNAFKLLASVLFFYCLTAVGDNYARQLLPQDKLHFVCAITGPFYHCINTLLNSSDFLNKDITTRTIVNPEESLEHNPEPSNLSML